MGGNIEYFSSDDLCEIRFKLFHPPVKTTCSKCDDGATNYTDFAFNNSVTICSSCAINAATFMNDISLTGRGLEEVLSLVISYYSHFNGKDRAETVSHDRSYLVFVGDSFEKKYEIDALLIEIMCLFNNKIVFGDVFSEGYEVKGIFNKAEGYVDGIGYLIAEMGDVERERGGWCPRELTVPSTGNKWYPTRKVQVW